MREEFTENKSEPERAVLVCVDCGLYDPDTSLDELEELARTAGAEVIARLVQKREKPEGSTYLGKGKLAELKALCENEEIDLIIVDGELTPAQVNNLEDESGVRVVDRTTLILDIFAFHSSSNEGKLQVELAQLKYSLPRLTGKGRQLSRLGGGIGTRGPGESKLESDRRHFRRRIVSLEKELESLTLRRNRLRLRRKKDGVQSVVIVGYTNAGKSTLMNALTQAGVLTEDKLFATLDPTSRALELPDGQKVMLIDTVGLIRRLPHQLVEAFKSTLEEALGADIILNVCDASSDECSEHLSVTRELLEELGVVDTPVITVMNKCDLVPYVSDLPSIGKCVYISAKTGEGLDKLLETVAASLPVSMRRERLLIPYSDASAAAKLRDSGRVFGEEYTENGIVIDVSADVLMLEKYSSYILEKG